MAPAVDVHEDSSARTRANKPIYRLLRIVAAGSTYATLHDELGEVLITRLASDVLGPSISIEVGTHALCIVEMTRGEAQCLCARWG